MHIDAPKTTDLRRHVIQEKSFLRKIYLEWYSAIDAALPWIIFQRDLKRFESEFPQWHLRTVKLMMPFSYIVSGGVSLRSLSPGWSYGLWRTIERTLRPLMPRLAMFAQIVLQKLSY